MIYIFKVEREDFDFLKKNNFELFKKVISEFDSALTIDSVTAAISGANDENLYKQEIFLKVTTTETNEYLSSLQSKNILPFSIFKNTTTNQTYSAGVHTDNYLDTREIGLQGPFTNEHVGGNQHRHIGLNSGLDDSSTRPELYSNNNGTITRKNITEPRAEFYRPDRVKRPVNIRNIKNTGSVVGNFSENYQVVNTAGRTENNLYFVQVGGLISTASIPSLFSVNFQDYALPERAANKTVIVNLFAAPGGPEVSSRGARDTAAEEFSVYNSLNNRNLVVRTQYDKWLRETSSLDSENFSYHQVNKNPTYYPTKTVYDNWFVSKQIPTNEAGYAWVSGALSGTVSGAFGYIKTEQPNIDASWNFVFLKSASSSLGIIDFVGTNTTVQKSINTSSLLMTGLEPDADLNSYLLNVNGPYGYPSWKQIRGSENLINIALKENSQLSVQDLDPSIPEKLKDSATTYVEPAFQYNKPLKIVVSNSLGDNQEIIAEYTNEKEYFANPSLQIRLTKSVPLPRETLYEDIKELSQIFGADGEPIYKIKNLKFEEKIFPRKEVLGLSEIRNKSEYAEFSGTGSNGYDRNIADIRTFWRDNLANRARTRGLDNTTKTGSINSLNTPNLSSSIQTNKLARIHNSPTPTSFTQLPVNLGRNRYFNLRLVSYFTHSYTDSVFSLDNTRDNLNIYATNLDISSSSGPFTGSIFVQHLENLNPLGDVSPINLRQETLNLGEATFAAGGGALPTETRYLYDEVSKQTLPVIFATTRPDIPFRAKPSIIHFNYSNWQRTSSLSGDSTLYPGYGFGKYKYVIYTRDYFSYPYLTNILSNNSPWYDSFQDYSQDVLPYMYDKSILPEFIIDKNINFYLLSGSGDFKEIVNYDYLTKEGFTTTFVNYSGSSNFVFSNAPKNLTKKKIKFDFSAVKKLLPYKGFYPAERCVDLVDLFQKSYFDISESQAQNFTDFPLSNGYFTNATRLQQQLQCVLQPLFAPGILFNSFKSGLACDFPVVISTASYDTGIWNDDTVPFYYYRQFTGSDFYMNYPNMPRLPFETILDVKNGFGNENFTTASSLYYQQPSLFHNDHTDNDTYRKFITKYQLLNNFRKNRDFTPLDSRYQLAINNFLSEIPNFFLQEGKLTTFISEEEKNFQPFVSGVVYYMDVVLEKDKDLKILYHDTASSVSHVFGPAHKGGSNIVDSSPYVPPYYYGPSIARISFRPSEDRLYYLREILNNSKVEYIKPLAFSTISTDSSAYTNASTISSSINLFQVSKNKNTTLDEKGNLLNASDTETTSKDRWAIQTKFECPVLNFENSQSAPYITASTLGEITFDDIPVIDPNDVPYYGADNIVITTNFKNKNVLGLWSGYGTVPPSNSSIKISLKESFTFSGNSLINNKTGSLLKACGFSVATKDIGKIADRKEIGEAVVIIPYTYNIKPKITTRYADTIQEILGENEVFLESDKEKGPFYFKIDQEVISKLLEIDFKDETLRLEAIETAINTFKSKGIKNSIIDSMDLMIKYNIPPHLNWIRNRKIEPFVIYIKEFKHILDKNDLVDIWQNLMPKIAKKSELTFETIEHDLSENEMFHGKELPEDLKFKMFKAKKRAKINYYDLTIDSRDDTKFQFKFNNQVVTPQYSYNYPYDFFSLIEGISVTAGLEFSEPDPFTPDLQERTVPLRKYQFINPKNIKKLSIGKISLNNSKQLSKGLKLKNVQVTAPIAQNTVKLPKIVPSGSKPKLPKIR